jgi:glycosyltransferase involved in cell wall biosynthesis
LSSNNKNILILANFLPDGGWGGGVIIRSLLQGKPQYINVFWTTYYPKLNKPEEKKHIVPLIPFYPRYIKGQSKIGFLRWLDSKRFATELNNLISAHHIDKLWIVLGSGMNELYRLSVLADTLTIPYHLTVHDDPIVELPASHKAGGENALKKIISHAQSMDVITDRMRKGYKEKYGKDAVVITRGIPDDFPVNDERDANQIHILMGGYGNAAAPWPKPLIDAVRDLNDTHVCMLHLFDPKLKIYESEQVKIYEGMPEVAFNLFLKNMHIGYACDGLTSERLAFAQLSLPTKIITYIGAGIPFVYHGPKDSTVGDLIAHYQVGIIVASNDANELSNAFRQLLHNYESHREECLRARRETFNAQHIQSKFFNHLIGSL